MHICDGQHENEIKSTRFNNFKMYSKTFELFLVCTCICSDIKHGVMYPEECYSPKGNINVLVSFNASESSSSYLHSVIQDISLQWAYLQVSIAATLHLCLFCWFSSYCPTQVYRSIQMVSVFWLIWQMAGNYVIFISFSYQSRSFPKRQQKKIIWADQKWEGSQKLYLSVRQGDCF